MKTNFRPRHQRIHNQMETFFPSQPRIVGADGELTIGEARRILVTSSSADPANPSTLNIKNVEGKEGQTLELIFVGPDRHLIVKNGPAAIWTPTTPGDFLRLKVEDGKWKKVDAQETTVTTPAPAEE